MSGRSTSSQYWLLFKVSVEWCRYALRALLSQKWSDEWRNWESAVLYAGELRNPPYLAVWRLAAVKGLIVELSSIQVRRGDGILVLSSDAYSEPHAQPTGF